MDLTVVVPAFNEQGRIQRALEHINAYFQGSGLSYEVLVVDDGSTDSTLQVSEQWSRSRSLAGIRAIRIPHQGKGAAVQAGVEAAAGKWILMTDADLSTPLSEWPKLKSELEQGAKLAIGSRQAAGAKIELRQPRLRQELGKGFGTLVGALFPVGVSDSQCGFKAFAAQAAKDLFSGLKARGYCFDVEIILKARAKDMEISEVPVRWKNHPDSRVKVWKDWPGIVRDLLLIRKEMRNSQQEHQHGARK